MGEKKMSSHSGLTHTVAQVLSGNAGGTVGLTSRPNRHAIGSVVSGRRDSVARYIR
ncbi:hypothetical protein E2C01_055357 [Portunus trituberculatus]|uniref:Uncharacterized protein n=1 Tax=Portunus trituberculatus TaxID=210409 RepID=A0A5B7GWK7_PORTR|nr:hypothetical protein [Portunus trituberculatus]